MHTPQLQAKGQLGKQLQKGKEAGCTVGPIDAHLQPRKCKQVSHHEANTKHRRGAHPQHGMGKEVEGQGGRRGRKERCHTTEPACYS